MFIRDCWYVAAWDSELPAAGLISRTLLAEPIVLYRGSDGEIVALEDRCCHRQAPLSLGRLEGDDLRCMYHGLKFDRTGRCIEIPGQESIPAAARVKRYAAVERHSWIWVWMGDCAAADLSLIPPAVGLEDPHWALSAGKLDYQANHMLIHDNLCDFSHIAYVHENTLAGGDDSMARTRPKVTTVERGIRVERWTVNAPVRGYVEGPATQDRWMRYDYLAPGVLLMRSEVHPHGVAAGCDFGEPHSDPIHAAFTSQAVTPMTQETSRYFYSWGPRATEAKAQPAICRQMLDLANVAFEEDRRMIEAQYRNQKQRPPSQPLVIGHDRGPFLMRAVFDRLLKRELHKDGMAAAGRGERASA